MAVTQPVAGETFSILPQYFGDAAWTASTLKPLAAAWRLKVKDFSQTIAFAHQHKEIRLGEGQGIGFFSFTRNDFSGALDLVKFTEFHMAVEGRLEPVGYDSYGNDSQFQPSGGM